MHKAVGRSGTSPLMRSLLLPTGHLLFTISTRLPYLPCSYNNNIRTATTFSTTTTRMSSNPNDEAFVNGDTTIVDRQQLLREILPACQPQEGSPANTFTDAELKELGAALTEHIESIQLKDDISKSIMQKTMKNSTVIAAADVLKMDICSGAWEAPSSEEELQAPSSASDKPSASSLFSLPRTFRESVRKAAFTGPTNGVCPGYLQCNLVVLPAGKIAFDFLLFCQRNSKACPLLEVCEGATSSFLPRQLADGADLRTDIPKYAIYRNGSLQEEVTDCTEYWPENAVAFLIGCSFSYDGALQNAGIPLRSAEAGKNVPMYKTSIACEPAGSLRGHMVVSMKPIPAIQVAKEVEITSKYTHAHGGPVCVGCPTAIGIQDIAKPDWGDAIHVQETDIPVFHACGVTPQAVLMESKVPFAITHAAGHMFVTDRPSDMGLL